MRTKACIVKRGNVWCVKQPLPDGKYRWTTVGPRKRDAETLRDDLNRRVVLGRAYPTQPERLNEFAAGWLERYGQRVRPATLEVAERSVAALNSFGHRTIESLTPAEIEDHVLQVARETPRTAELMLETLKAMLRNAQQRGQRVDERIFSARAPRRDRREMRFLTWSEAEQLADETIPAYSGLIKFACLTGLRQGELFALRATRVDLDRQRVIVDAGARNGSLVPTKSRAGRRQVKLSQLALTVLREQLIARPAGSHDLVFPTPTGALWRKDNFMSRVYRPAVRRAGLEPLRFHDLRHTYAALMVRQAHIRSCCKPSLATLRSRSH